MAAGARLSLSRTARLLESIRDLKMLSSWSLLFVIGFNISLTKYLGQYLTYVNVLVPHWPDPPHTVIAKTPSSREKPYVVIDAAGKYSVAVPAQKVDSSSISWGPGTPATPTLPIEKFNIAHAGHDTAGSINDALTSGKPLIMTSGVYQLQNNIPISNGTGKSVLWVPTGIDSATSVY